MDAPAPSTPSALASLAETRIGLTGFTLPIKKWLEIATEKSAGTCYHPDDAIEVLARSDLRVIEELGSWYLAVPNSSPSIEGLFRRTRWVMKSGGQHLWMRSLRRIPGAVVPKNALRFQGRKGRRCTFVPLALIIDLDHLDGAEAPAGPAGALAPARAC